MFLSLLPIWISHKLQPTEKIDDDMCPAREAILICFQEIHVFAQLQWNQMASLMQTECKLAWEEDHGVIWANPNSKENNDRYLSQTQACDYVVVNKQGELKVSSLSPYDSALLQVWKGLHLPSILGIQSVQSQLTSVQINFTEICAGSGHLRVFQE